MYIYLSFSGFISNLSFLKLQLICTVTPSSSSAEETHNTLKFAHRAKHIEIQAAQNKIIDEKSLIKKYQNEIRCLKEELEQLKRGIVTLPQLKDAGEENIVLLKQKVPLYYVGFVVSPQVPTFQLFLMLICNLVSY
ncbi:hypothetical protein CsSME_00045321 [Camellia sinensis var. sinensis]